MMEFREKIKHFVHNNMYTPKCTFVSLDVDGLLSLSEHEGRESSESVGHQIGGRFLLNHA